MSKGLDRDRAVDESGNQIAVFGRVGARPLNKEEQRKLYLRNGKVWTVSDDPADGMYGPPRAAGESGATLAGQTAIDRTEIREHA